MSQIIRSRAPLRISFGGGGTEIDPYRSKSGGEVLNSTISLYAYTTIKESDLKDTISFIASDLKIKEKYSLNALLKDDKCLKKSKLKIHIATFKNIIEEHGTQNLSSLEITTFCDAPVGSGLGSSSTLTVAIIEAFNKYLNLDLNKYEIAKKAFYIEREKLGLYGGQQDQFSAAFGGFNYIDFKKSGLVNVSKLNLAKKTLLELEASLILAYTGISRDSGKIIESQIKKDISNDTYFIENLNEIKIYARKMKKELLKNNIVEFGHLLDQSWAKKRKLSKLISSKSIDNLYSNAKDLGAYGGKISGAGGGGFFMIICNPTKKRIIINELIKMNNQIYTVHFSKNGSESWEI